MVVTCFVWCTESESGYCSGIFSYTGFHILHCQSFREDSFHTVPSNDESDLSGIDLCSGILALSVPLSY